MEEKNVLRKGLTILYACALIIIPIIIWQFSKLKLFYLIFGAITLYGIIVIILLMIESFKRFIQKQVYEVLKKEGVIKNDNKERTN